VKRLALLLVVLVGAGCGGAAKQTAAEPHLPRALAQQWAQRADAIAAADPCTAHRRASALRTDVILAINSRKIPQGLLEPLTSKVNALAAHKTCAPVQREAHDLAAWLRNPSG
jgi:hypothetical protein